MRSREESWGAAIRRSPVGVLVLAAALCFVGAGAVLGGIYLIFSATTAIGWAGWGMLLVAAPVTLYVALHLVLRSRWVWSTVLIALSLLLVTSVLRAFATPGVPIAAIGEVLVEVLFIGYLTRPRIRAAFGRS